MLKMVITDLDGTLIPEGTDDFPTEILDIFQKLQARGIHTGVASGRSYSNLRKLFAPIATPMFFCSENGTLIYNGSGQLLHGTPLPRPTVEALFACAASYPNAEILLGTESASYVRPRSPEFMHLIRDVKKLNMKTAHTVEEIQEPVFKISVHCPDDIEGFRAELYRNGTPDCMVVPSADGWLDLSSCGKADGIRFVLEHLDIDPAHVMYFGDNYNDLETLKLVGHPWLRDIAPPELKAMFPNQTDDVVKTLEQIFSEMSHGGKSWNKKGTSSS